MKRHPFRAAIEADATTEEFAKLFSENVVFKGPMWTKPIVGRTTTLEVVRRAAKLLHPIEYGIEASDSHQTILVWSGKINGFVLEATTILVDDEQGLIREVRVLMRPWPVFTFFRDAMYEQLSATIPAEFWELGEAKPRGTARDFTPIELAPIDMAEGMVLHSPMLAKSVSGKARVVEAVGLAHQIQSRSSYTCIIATPKLVIEVFDCDADGHPMEGIWIQKINDEGQIYDLTVMLRPYPAVTVLRNGTKRLAEQAGVLVDKDYWKLPNLP
jgi:hypothetical protein